MVKILIEGYYGVPNAGDEAILSSILSITDDYYKELELIVGSFNPENTLNRYSIHSSIPRFSYRNLPNMVNWIQEVKSVDELWIGGGGLFSDGDMLRYSLMIFFSKIFNTRVKIICVGAADLNKETKQQRLLRKSISYTDIVSVRDEQSANQLYNIGIDDVELLPDPVFSMPCSKEIGFENKEDVIGVSVREYRHRSLDRDELAEAIDMIISYTDCKVLFLPFKEEDYRVSEDIIGRMSSNADIYCGTGEWEDLNSIIAKSRIIIGMRFHSIVFSAINRTPCVGIAYHQKCTNLLSKLDKDVFWSDNLNSRAIFNSTINKWRSGITQSTRNNINKLEEEAKDIMITIDGLEDGEVRHPPIFMLLLEIMRYLIDR